MIFTPEEIIKQKYTYKYDKQYLDAALKYNEGNTIYFAEIKRFEAFRIINFIELEKLLNQNNVKLEIKDNVLYAKITKEDLERLMNVTYRKNITDISLRSDNLKTLKK